MFSIKSWEKTIVLFSICILFYIMNAESSPLSKRSVTEVQLMHNVGARQRVQERQRWLQEKMERVERAGAQSEPHEDSAKLRDIITPAELEHILHILDKLQSQ